MKTKLKRDMCTNNTQIFVKSDRYSNKTDKLPVFNDITMKPRSVDVQNLKTIECLPKIRNSICVFALG